MKITSSPSSATILGAPIDALGREKLRIEDNVYDLSPELHKALSSMGYSGKTMKNENDILLMNKIKIDLKYLGIGDKSSRRKISQEHFLN